MTVLLAVLTFAAKWLAAGFLFAGGAFLTIRPLKALDERLDRRAAIADVLRRSRYPLAPRASTYPDATDHDDDRGWHV